MKFGRVPLVAVLIAVLSSCGTRTRSESATNPASDFAAFTKEYFGLLLQFQPV